MAGAGIVAATNGLDPRRIEICDGVTAMQQTRQTEPVWRVEVMSRESVCMWQPRSQELGMR
jgi:hypothetical protein